MQGGVDLVDGDIHCVVAEVQCRYIASIAFPDVVTVGLRVARLGTSSVRYELAIFRNEEDEASAEGYFVHVFVQRGAQRPVRSRRSPAGGWKGWSSTQPSKVSNCSRNSARR